MSHRNAPLGWWWADPAVGYVLVYPFVCGVNCCLKNSNSVAAQGHSHVPTRAITSQQRRRSVDRGLSGATSRHALICRDPLVQSVVSRGASYRRQ